MALSSPTLRQHLNRVRQASGNDPRAVTGYLNMRFYGDPSYSPAAKEKKGFFSRVADTIYQQFLDLGQSQEDYKTGRQGYVDTMLQNSGNLAHILGAPVEEGLKTGIGFAAEKTGVTDALASAAQTPTGQSIVEGLQQAGQKYEQIKEVSPAARSLEGVVEGLVSLGDVGLGLQAFKGTVGGAKAISSAVRHPIQTIRGTAGAAAAQTDDVAKGAMGRVSGAITDKMDDAARLRTMPGEYQRAVKSGIDEPFVKMTTEATVEEKGLMRKMLDLSEEGSKDLLKVNKAKEVAGQTILNRGSYLVKARKATGQSLGNIVKANSTEVVPLRRTQQMIAQQLDDLGIMVAPDGKLVSVGSVPDADLPFFRDVLKRLSFKDGDDLVANVGKAHSTRQWMFNEMDLASVRQQPFSNLADRFAKNVHRAMLDDVTQVIPQYRPLSQAYAEMTEPLKNLTKLIGYKGSLDDLGEEALRTGEVAQRIFGNASARPRDVIFGLDQVAQKYGYVSTTQIERLLRFADRVEDYFPTSQTTSLGGRVERAGQKIAEDYVEGGLLRAGRKQLKKGLDAAFGTRQEDQIAALRSLLDKTDDATGAAATGRPPPGSLPGPTTAPGGPGSQLPPQGPNATGIQASAGTVPDDLVPLNAITPGQQAEATFAKAQTLTSYDISKAKPGDVIEVPLSTEIIGPPEGIRPKDWTILNIGKREAPRMSESVAGPIEVVLENGKLRLFDGVHRLGAAIREGKKTISVRISE